MRRLPTLLAGLALTSVLGGLAACGGEKIRLSGDGESCTRTADCEEPFVCIALTCVTKGSGTDGTGSPGGTGASDTGTTTNGTGGEGTAGGAGAAGGMGGAGGTGGTGGSGGVVLDPVACGQCLDEACAPEKAACDSECLGIEACIETLCSNLSAIASPEEGQCQVHCQQLHLSGKSNHIALVNCAISAWPDCKPCSSYPFDYNACVTALSIDGGDCKDEYDACNASADCLQYRDCVSVCGTLASCLACDDTPEGMNGAALYGAYESCIAPVCVEESWLP